MSPETTIAVLGDPTRGEILRQLSRRSGLTAELAVGVSITGPAASKPTSVLTGAAGYRAQERTRTVCELARSAGRRMRAMIKEVQDLEQF